MASITNTAVAVRYTVTTKYARLGSEDPKNKLSFMLDSEYGALAPLPYAKPIKGTHNADYMYWIVGTENSLRHNRNYNEWVVEPGTVEVLEFTIIAPQDLSMNSRVNAAKEFLDREADELPYWSGKELRAALGHWPEDAVRSLAIPGYGLFCDNGCLRIYMPSDRAVANELRQPLPRRSLTISGHDSWPVSDDPADGWESRYWTATYSIR